MIRSASSLTGNVFEEWDLLHSVQQVAQLLQVLLAKFCVPEATSLSPSSVFIECVCHLQLSQKLSNLIYKCIRGVPQSDNCQTVSDSVTQSWKWFVENAHMYGGPEGTSLHKFFIPLHQFWLVWKNIMGLCIHNYLACIHNHLACIHNILHVYIIKYTCIHNYLACIHNYLHNYLACIHNQVYMYT